MTEQERVPPWLMVTMLFGLGLAVAVLISQCMPPKDDVIVVTQPTVTPVPAEATTTPTASPGATATGVGDKLPTKLPTATTEPSAISTSTPTMLPILTSTPTVAPSVVQKG